MNKRKMNIGGIICLIVGIYCMYYMLLTDNSLPCSIKSVEASLSHWIKHWRVVVVGLMPIYVALTIFGVAICSLFVGSALHHWVAHFLHGKNTR